MAGVDDKSFRISRENDFPVVLLYLYLHIFSVFAPFMIKNTLISTYIFGILLIFIGVLGATAGAHRLWAHRSYVADVKLRIFLMICFCISGQGTIYNWVLEHRMHHKYFGTKLDQFNHNKSIFNLQTLARVTKPSEGYDKLKEKIDMSDIENDAVVMFQKKYFIFLYLLFALLLPINAPAEYWGEGLTEASVLIGVVRYLITTHLISLIETSPKIWGCSYKIDEDNDKKLVETVEKMDWVTYHYIAPWDYQTNEYGFYGNDIITKFINSCQMLGLVSGQKSMNTHIIGQAIHMSMTSNKPITDCLSENQFTDPKSSKFRMSHSLN